MRGSFKDIDFTIAISFVIVIGSDLFKMVDFQVEILSIAKKIRIIPDLLIKENQV